MASTSTLRLPSDLRQWVDKTATDGGVSGNRCIELLIEHARARGWRIAPAAVKGEVPPDKPLGVLGGLPEDVPQVPGLMAEDTPAGQGR
jgi:hypothetical protein